MQIYSDRAIQTKTEDALGRGDFAEHLATGILNWKSPESLCIALEGPWGSGKSSILNLSLEAIRTRTSSEPTDKQPIILNFQPWLISGQEKLVRAFLSELRKKLKQSNLSSHAREAAKHLEKYEKVLSLASFVPVVGDAA